MANYSQNLTQALVWYLEPESIGDTATCDSLMRWLSDDERARMQRFHASRHRHAYLVSHALVRGALARELACDPSSLVFETNAFGKPQLVQPASTPRLEFNLSHTDGLCVVALSWQSRLGCDVEHLDRPGLDVEISKSFTPEESEEIATHPSERQIHRLLSYWTLKEAYIKAEGKGLSMGLDTFYFSLDSDSPRLMLKHGAQQPSAPWQFKQVILRDRFLFSLAIACAEDVSQSNETMVEFKQADWIAHSLR
jgi:4'-phosphopantetheinyl transferase